ncbi:6357_t:CDS:2 [Funneliformis caledonium]|uniref:6357_t:CDS:1 n=1 Tax=Funneliformis caledonium TaxID=1117310 RepID=A0A9N9B650_9GLOM|nr:6357_t:CDS:2 [Funneliformis caledonium]
MPSSITSTNPSELSAELLQDENFSDLNISEILEDMDKAEGALNELDERLDNLNAKIDALLEEQAPNEIKSAEEEKTEKDYYSRGYTK